MKKVVILAVIAAVTMSVSAQASSSRHKQNVASNAKQCWIATDNLSHGYWMSCGSLTPSQIAAIKTTTLVSTEGGGGAGGGGGGGGR